MPFPDVEHPACLRFPAERSFTIAETYLFLAKMGKRKFQRHPKWGLLLEKADPPGAGRVVVMPDNWIVWHGNNMEAMDGVRFADWGSRRHNRPHILHNEDVPAKAAAAYRSVDDMVWAAPVDLGETNVGWRLDATIHTTLAYLLRGYSWKVEKLTKKRFAIDVTPINAQRRLFRPELTNGDWVVRTSLGMQFLPGAVFPRLFTRA